MAGTLSLNWALDSVAGKLCWSFRSQSCRGLGRLRTVSCVPPELQFRAPAEGQAEEGSLAGGPWVVLPTLPFLDSWRSISPLLLSSSTRCRVEAPAAHLSPQPGFYCRCLTCSTEPGVGPLYRNGLFWSHRLGMWLEDVIQCLLASENPSQTGIEWGVIIP